MHSQETQQWICGAFGILELMVVRITLLVLMILGAVSILQNHKR